MTVIQWTLCAFNAVQKIFGKHPPIQSADGRSLVNTLFDRPDPLCACFQAGQINLLSTHCGRSLISTLFPLSLYHPFFFNSHNTVVRRMFASQRTVNGCTRAYETARWYLALRTALDGNECGGAGSRLLFGENYTRTAKHIHLLFRHGV